MLNTAIIGVAIGLIFVFSLLAIMVTQINNFIINVLNLRAKQLKSSLQALVTDQKTQAWLLTHPLINMVKTNVEPSKKLDNLDQIVNAEATKVAWIPAATFVDALTDILTTEADKVYRPLQQAVEAVPSMEHKSKLREFVRTLRSGFSEQTIRSLKDAVAVVEDEAARTKLLSTLQTLEDSLEKLNFKTEQLVPLLEGVSKISDQRFRIALETILNSAKTIEEAQAKLEHWFNDGMSRASDVYKRNLGFVSLIVAFVTALVLNVDTLFLARTLWEDPELRQSVVTIATQYNQSTAPQPESGSDTTAQGAEETGDPDVTMEVLAQSVEDLGVTLQELLELQLPIGWEYTEITDDMVLTSQQVGLPDPRDNTRNFWNLIPGNGNWLTLWLQKLIGLLATAIAAAQGAPFWFDLLNRFSRPRSA